MERVADGPLASARKEKGIQFANEPAECRTSEVCLRPGATILACVRSSRNPSPMAQPPSSRKAKKA